MFDQKNLSSDAPVTAQVQKAHRPAELIVMAVSFSIAIYTVIGLILVSSAEATEGPSPYRIPFIAAALFLSLGSISLRRAQFRWPRLQAVADAQGVAGLLRHLANMTIVSAVIGEAVGILGLLISFFGGGQTEVIIFGAIGLMVTLSSYPRRGAWEKAANYFAMTTPGVAANSWSGKGDMGSNT